MDEILEGLNNAQMEAVTSTEGFVRVIAGAGSGKTRALTHRFAYLVTELGVLPGNILCVTFTNKAANEMRQRIHQLTGDNDTGYISTFHGFCVNILQEDSHAIGYPKSFMVLDNSDIDEMLKIIYEERGLTLRDKTFASARDMFETIFSDYKQEKDVHISGLLADLMNQTPVTEADFAALAGKILLILPDQDFFSGKMQQDLIQLMHDPQITYVSGGHLSTVLKAESYIPTIRSFLQSLDA